MQEASSGYVMGGSINKLKGAQNCAESRRILSLGDVQFMDTYASLM
jgi:hypothetical protein